MTPCRTATPGGPCARPAGHAAQACLDVVAYTDLLVRERTRITTVAQRLGCVARGRRFTGLVTLVGSAGLRRAVWLNLLANVDRDATLFGRGVSEVFDLPVSPVLRPWPIPAQRDLRSFVLETVPEFVQAADPAAQFGEHLQSYRRRNLGAAVLIVDDVDGLASGLVAPEVLGWLLTRSTEMPVFFGSTPEGWERFRRYAVSAGRGALVVAAHCRFDIAAPMT